MFVRGVRKDVHTSRWLGSLMGVPLGANGNRFSLVTYRKQNEPKTNENENEINEFKLSMEKQRNSKET